MPKPLAVTRKHRCFTAEVSEQYRTLTIEATLQMEQDAYSTSDEKSLMGKPAIIISIGTSERAMTIDMAKAVVETLNEAIAAAGGAA